MLIPHHDFFAVAMSDDSFAGRVFKLTWIVIRNAQLRRFPEDRLSNRVFGTRLSNRGGCEQECGGNIWGCVHVQKLRSSIGQSAGLVEKNCIDFTKFFEVKPTFDDRTLLGGPAYRPQDSQRGSRRDAASSCYDDHRNGRTNVVADQESQDGSTQRKINEITCKSVRNSLNRGACFLPCFNRVNG